MIFYDLKHISSGQWKPLLAQEQTLMLLEIIHREKTLGEMQDFYVDQRVSIFHHAASLCVFLKCCLMLRLRFVLKVAGIQRLDLHHDSETLAGLQLEEVLFVMRMYRPLACGIETGLYLKIKTTVIEYKPPRTTNLARHYILKSALSSITNAFQESMNFCVKIAW